MILPRQLDMGWSQAQAVVRAVLLGFVAWASVVPPAGGIPRYS